MATILGLHLWSPLLPMCSGYTQSASYYNARRKTSNGYGPSYYQTGKARHPPIEGREVHSYGRASPIFKDWGKPLTNTRRPLKHPLCPRIYVCVADVHYIQLMHSRIMDPQTHAAQVIGISFTCHCQPPCKWSSKLSAIFIHRL